MFGTGWGEFLQDFFGHGSVIKEDDVAAPIDHPLQDIDELKVNIPEPQKAEDLKALEEHKIEAQPGLIGGAIEKIRSIASGAINYAVDTGIKAGELVVSYADETYRDMTVSLENIEDQLDALKTLPQKIAEKGSSFEVAYQKLIDLYAKAINESLNLSVGQSEDEELLGNLCQDCANAIKELDESGLSEVPELRAKIGELNRQILTYLKSEHQKELSLPLANAQERLGSESKIIKDVSETAENRALNAIQTLETKATDIAFEEGDLNAVVELMDEDKLYNYLFGEGGESAHLAEIVKELGLPIPSIVINRLVSSYNIKPLFKAYWTKEIAGDAKRYAEALQKLKETKLEYSPDELVAQLQGDYSSVYQKRAAFLFKELGLDKKLEEVTNLETLFTNLYGSWSFGPYAEHATNLDETLKFWGIPDVLVAPIHKKIATILTPDNIEAITEKTLTDIQKFVLALQELRDYEQKGGFPVSDLEKEILSKLNDPDLPSNDRAALLNQYDKILSSKRSAFLYQKLVGDVPLHDPSSDKPFYVETFTKQWSDAIAKLALADTSQEDIENAKPKWMQALTPLTSGIGTISKNIKGVISEKVSAYLENLMKPLRNLANTGEALPGQSSMIGSYTNIDDLANLVPNIADFAVWFISTKALENVSVVANTKPKAQNLDATLKSTIEDVTNLAIPPSVESDSQAKKGLRAIVDRATTLFTTSFNPKKAISNFANKLQNWMSSKTPIDKNRQELEIVKQRNQKPSAASGYIPKKIGRYLPIKETTLKPKSKWPAEDLKKMGALYEERAALFKAKIEQRGKTRFGKQVTKALNDLAELYRTMRQLTGYKEAKGPIPTEIGYERKALDYLKAAYAKEPSDDSQLLKAYIRVYKLVKPGEKNKIIEEVRALKEKKGEPLPIEFEELLGDVSLEKYEKAAGVRITPLGSVIKGETAAVLRLAEKSDPDTAFQFYLMAYIKNKDDPECCFRFGQFIMENPSLGKEYPVTELLETAADKGHTGAQIAYGRQFVDHEIGDAKLAVQYLRQAAKKNNGEALVLLGKCHEMGRGLAKNTIQANNYYNAARDMGYQGAIPDEVKEPPRVEKTLQEVLQEAKKSQTDLERATHYIEAGRLGYAKGYMMASKLQSDPEQAIKLVKRAALMGDADAVKATFEHHLKNREYDICIHWLIRTDDPKGSLEQMAKKIEEDTRLEEKTKLGLLLHANHLLEVEKSLGEFSS